MSALERLLVGFRCKIAYVGLLLMMEEATAQGEDSGDDDCESNEGAHDEFPLRG